MDFASLAHIYAGRTMFVLGNGPSLRGIYLNHLPHEYTIGVNRIHWSMYDPKWLVLVDGDAWRDVKDHVARARCFLLVGTTPNRQGLYDQVTGELPSERTVMFFHCQPGHPAGGLIKSGLTGFVAAQIAARMVSPGGTVVLCGMDLSYPESGPTHSYEGRGTGCRDVAFPRSVHDFVGLRERYSGDVRFIVIGSSRLSDHGFTSGCIDDML